MIGLCDCSNTSTLEVAVHFKRDVAAEKPIDNGVVNEAVRPKSDMDAENSAETDNENGAGLSQVRQ